MSLFLVSSLISVRVISIIFPFMSLTVIFSPLFINFLWCSKNPAAIFGIRSFNDNIMNNINNPKMLASITFNINAVSPGAAMQIQWKSNNRCILSLC